MFSIFFMGRDGTELKVGCAVIFASKRNEAKRKQHFFRLFRINAIRINLRWNENETKWKRNKKEAKIANIFASKRNEVKRKRNIFCFYAKKVFFAYKMKRNNTKKNQKLQSEKG